MLQNDFYTNWILHISIHKILAHNDNHITLKYITYKPLIMDNQFEIVLIQPFDTKHVRGDIIKATLREGWLGREGGMRWHFGGIYSFLLKNLLIS